MKNDFDGRPQSLDEILVRVSSCPLSYNGELSNSIPADANVANKDDCRPTWAKRLWMLCIVLWLICLPLPGCTAAHDGWAPGAKPIPIVVPIVASLASLPFLLLQFEIVDGIVSLANWAFLFSILCGTSKFARGPYVPWVVAALLPGYWIFGIKRLLGFSVGMTLLFGYYAVGIVYLLAAIAWLGIGIARWNVSMTPSDEPP